MTLQLVNEALTGQPFQPVRIVLADGASYEVRQREMLLLTRTSLVVGTDVADNVPTNFKILSIPQIVAIDPLEATTHGAKATPRQRVADLHPGAMETSTDFDAPFGDELWTGGNSAHS